MRRKIYGPVNHCIYCLSDSSILTTEHVVPYALNGPMELLESSCEACAKVTGSIEQKILRGSLWPVRSQLGLNSRRPKEQPRTFPIELVDESGIERVDVPVDRHLTLLVTPVFDLPSFFDGVGTVDTFKYKAIFAEHVTKNSRDRLESFKPITSVRLQINIDPSVYGRFLAKIGHSLSVAILGKDTFDPFLPSTILGTENHLKALVGTSTQLEPPTESLHSLQIATCNGFERPYVVACIRLFSRYGSPTQVVVVGQLKSGLREKLPRIGGDPPVGSSARNLFQDPRVYPLPYGPL